MYFPGHVPPKARKVVGFYWTLPVPWAGFTQLPKDPDEAARFSRTIRYQRDLIRRKSKDRHDGFTLIHEEAHISLHPDRSGDDMDFESLLDMCQKQGARLAYVNFSQEAGWRTHHHLQHRLYARSVESLEFPPERILMNGKDFYPEEHFRGWREKSLGVSEAKHERARKAFSRAEELRKTGATYNAIAAILNEEGFLSLTAKQWTPESLRKFMSKVRY